MAKYPILQHFGYAHLPVTLQPLSKRFHDLAHELVSTVSPGAETSTALRKLLEAKDAAIRSAIDSGFISSIAGQSGTADSDFNALRSAGNVDVLTGRPLPPGSPYSSARAPVEHDRASDEAAAEKSTLVPGYGGDAGQVKTTTYPHGYRQGFPNVKQYQDGSGVFRWDHDHTEVPPGLEAAPMLAEKQRSGPPTPRPQVGAISDAGDRRGNGPAEVHPQDPRRACECEHCKGWRSALGIVEPTVFGPRHQ